jgi:hypothetical protein
MDMRFFQFLVIHIFMSLNVQAKDLPQIRKDYYASVNSAKVADKFYEELKNKNSKDPIILAYLGSTMAVRAKHAINPYKKLSYLKSGSKTLNSAVASSPNNLEIRFLRFTLEHYIPGFLGYNEHLAEDRKKIIELCRSQRFGEMDKPLLTNLLSFMKETKRCSPQEIATLEQAIKNG